MKKVGTNVLSREEVHTVMLTAVYKKLERCCAETAKALPVFNRVRTEYSDGGTADGDKIKYFLFPVGLTTWKPIEDEIVAPNFLTNIFWRWSCLRSTDIWKSLLLLISCNHYVLKVQQQGLLSLMELLQSGMLAVQAMATAQNLYCLTIRHTIWKTSRDKTFQPTVVQKSRNQFFPLIHL